MADEIERLLVRVEANANQFDAQMRKLNKSLYAAQAENRKALGAIQRDTETASRRMFTPIGAEFRKEVAGMAASVAALFTTQQIIKFADDWTSARNALAAAGIATSDLAERQQQLVDLANETRTSTASTVELYARLTRATSELGMTQADVLRLTELLNKSFASSGLSTQEAASAALQLSQALASGQLQGDELRSLRENAPAVAQAIASAMGVGIGALKDLGAEGKLTASVVASAILGAGDAIETQFAATQVTVSQSLTILNNELGRFIGQTDAAGSASARMAQAIVALSQNLDVVVTAAGVAVTIVGTRWVVAQTTAAAATAAHTGAQIALIAAISGTSRAALAGSVALRGLGTAAMFFVTNPIGIAITAIAGALALVSLRGREATNRSEEFRDSMGGARDAMVAYEEAAKASANATAQNAAQMKQSAEAARIDALYRLENARAIRIQTAALAEQRAREAVVADRQANTIGTPYPGLMGGQALQASQRSKIARQEADAARDAAAQAEREYNRITRNMRAGSYRTAPGPAPAPAAKATPGRTTSGPSEADLAAQRQMLTLQGQVELLKAQGRDADAAAAQRQIDTLNLTKQYEDAGFTDAKARAEQLVASVAQAEAAEKGRAYAVERTREITDAVTEGLRIQNDVMIDRLRLEADLAQLAGDPSRIKAAERALFIEERTNELLAMRPGLITAAEARQQATGEFDQMTLTGREGEMRELFRSSFRDGIQAAIEGDLGGLFKSLADRFTDRMLDNLADDLFNVINGSGGKDGGGIFGAIASGIGSLFGGRYATGGTVRGPGGPTSDQVPILASNGEFVVNAKAAKRHRAVLEALNSGLPAFAQGGLVATNEAGAPESFYPS